MQPPFPTLVTVPVFQILHRLDEDNRQNPSQIFKTEKLKPYRLIHFLYLVQPNLKRPPPNCNKIGLVPCIFPLKTNNSEVPQTLILVLVTLACWSFVLSLSSMHIQLTLKVCSAPRRRAEKQELLLVSTWLTPTLLNALPVLPLGTSFLACKGLVSKQRRWNFRDHHTRITV